MTFEATAPAPHFRRQMFTLFLVVFISLVGFGIVVPVFPFFGRMVGAGADEITLAIAAYSLGQFIGAPLWGQMSDRYGRKPILFWSLVGSMLAYALMAHAYDIWTLGLSRLIGGLMAGNIATAFAYVGDITTAKTRPKAMGIIGAAFGAGFIFGPAIGGIVSGNSPGAGDLLAIGYISALVTAIAALCTLTLLQESLTHDRRRAPGTKAPAFASVKIMVHKPVVAWLSLLTLLVIGAAALMEATFAFLASDRFAWSPREVGLSFGLIGAIAAVLQGVAAEPMTRWFGEGRVVCGSLIIYALGLAGMGWANSNWTLIIALSLTAVGVGLFSPAYQSFTAAQSNDTDRGLVMGVTQSAGAMGRVVGPAVAGAIYLGIGPSAPFYYGGAIMAFSFFIAAYIVWRYRTPHA